jgi:hypothetical protein
MGDGRGGESYRDSEEYKDGSAADRALYDALYGARTVKSNERGENYSLWVSFGNYPWWRFGRFLVATGPRPEDGGRRLVYRLPERRTHINPKAGWDSETKQKGQPLVLQYPWEGEGYGRDYSKWREPSAETDDHGSASCSREVCFTCGTEEPLPEKRVCASCYGSRRRPRHPFEGTPQYRQIYKAGEALNFFAPLVLKPSSGSLEEENYLKRWADPTFLDREWRASGYRPGPRTKGETDVGLALERARVHLDGTFESVCEQFARPGPKRNRELYRDGEVAIVALAIEGFNTGTIATAFKCRRETVQRVLRRFRGSRRG